MPVHGTKDIYPPYPIEQPVFQFRTKRYAEDFEYISDFETLLDWTLTAGDSRAVDAVNFKEGSQGIRWRSINAVITTAERAININCFGKHPELWMYIDDVANYDMIRVRFYAGAVRNFYSRYNRPDAELWTGWHKLVWSRACFVPNGGAVTADWANITKVVIDVRSQVGTTVDVTFDDFRMVRDRFAGKVTLRFDDAHEDTYTEARARMDEYGFRGVAAVHIIRIGEVGALTLAQLTHLQERGWDIISHSMTHPILTTLTPAEVERELWRSQRWLIEHGFYKGSRFFVPPGNRVNAAVLEQIKSYYLACSAARTFVSDTRADAIPPNPFFMQTEPLHDAIPLATVQGWVDDVVEDQGWLTLMLHNIDDMLVLFQNVIDYIEASGLEVVTFSDVFDEFIGSTLGVKSQLLEFGVQGVITPNATSYPCPGGALAAATANEIKIPVSRGGWLKNLRVRQRVASGAGGRTDIYTVRVNGVDTDLTCTLDNATVGSDLTNHVYKIEGDEVSVKLVSNNVADVSADVSVTVELELSM